MSNLSLSSMLLSTDDTAAVSSESPEPSPLSLDLLTAPSFYSSTLFPSLSTFTSSFSPAVLVWWLSLSTIAIINVIIATRRFLYLNALSHKPPAVPQSLMPHPLSFYPSPPCYAFPPLLSTPLSPSIIIKTRVSSILGLIFVFVCAFRSFLPRIDVERVCLFDTSLSFIGVGRSAATVAEISFGAQLTLFFTFLVRGTILHNSAAQGDAATQALLTSSAAWTTSSFLSLTSFNLQRFLQRFVSYACSSFFYLSVIANCSCWLAVLSHDNLFHALEETLWGFMGLLAILTVSFHRLFQRWYNAEASVDPTEVMLCRLIIILASVYSAFMFSNDIPMYVNKWLIDMQNGNPYQQIWPADQLLLAVQDTFRCTQMRHFDFWGREMAWLGGYFTGAVWLSIYMMNTPNSIAHPSNDKLKSN